MIPALISRPGPSLSRLSARRSTLFFECHRASCRGSRDGNSRGISSRRVPLWDERATLSRKLFASCPVSREIERILGWGIQGLVGEGLIAVTGRGEFCRVDYVDVKRDVFNHSWQVGV